jgi:hypothetical protein
MPPPGTPAAGAPFRMKMPSTRSVPPAATSKMRTAPADGLRRIVVDGPPTMRTLPVMIGSASVAVAAVVTS